MEKKNNDELNVCVNDIKKQLNRIEYDNLRRIESKQDKTNGRVRNLEIWRGFITGGLAILALLILPLVIMAAQEFIQ